MKVKWNVDTGYVNRESPRVVEIDDEDLEDMDDAEREAYIDQCIQEDFEQRITWHRVSK